MGRSFPKSIAATADKAEPGLALAAVQDLDEDGELTRQKLTRQKSQGTYRTDSSSEVHSQWPAPQNENVT